MIIQKVLYSDVGDSPNSTSHEGGGNSLAKLHLIPRGGVIYVIRYDLDRWEQMIIKDVELPHKISRMILPRGLTISHHAYT